MWLPGPSVIVVTGASTGIGFNVVKDLVSSYDGTIYLTCHNERAGKMGFKRIPPSLNSFLESQRSVARRSGAIG